MLRLKKFRYVLFSIFLPDKKFPNQTELKIKNMSFQLALFHDVTAGPIKIFRWGKSNHI